MENKDKPALTLQEKISEESNKYSYALRQRIDFQNGANWILSELKPVMEEMKQALIGAKIALNAHGAWQWPETTKHIDETISKYNELFNK